MKVRDRAEQATVVLLALAAFALVPVAVVLRLLGEAYAATVRPAGREPDVERTPVDPTAEHTGALHRKRSA